MSSSLPAPENPAFSGTLSQPKQAQAGALADGDKKNKNSRPPPRAKSASLLTQALATNYEAEEEATTTDNLFQSSSAPRDPAKEQFERLQRDIPQSADTSVGSAKRYLEQSQQDLQNNGLDSDALSNAAEQYPERSQQDVQDNGVNSNDTANRRGDNMAMVSPVADLQSSAHFALASSDIGNFHSLFSNNRGRGTSLERTDKEKRVEEPAQGPVSTNPGDTGMSGHVTPQSPVTPDISANPPTDGVRARYRSWRDARPPTAERAWSIGQQGSDESGQVENSIKEALAGIEPNSRSRKASHSMRFFKEGLPEDKSKKKDNKARGQSKDGSSQGRAATVVETSKAKPNQERSKIHDSPSPLPSPLERDRFLKDGHPKQDAPNFDQSEPGYFDISSSSKQLSDEQMQSFPAQLLADIRKNHNLTPGANKGTSFSRSIPVTESEKSLPEVSSNDSANAHSNHSNLEDDSDLHLSKTDEDEDSGEEHISSAVFVPHQTSHDSPGTEIDEPDSLPRPTLQRQEKLEVSNSQQWLEEHEVPSRNLDEKYLTSKESKPKPLPSPKAVKPPTPRVEQDPYFPEVIKAIDIERDVSDTANSTKGDESGLNDDQESDTTPTGSPKREIRAAATTPKLHDHQHEQKQPLEAIELIPYRHQVGGHTTMWRFSKRAVCKQLNNRENEFYEKVERFHPKLLKFLPRYIGVLNVNFEKQRRKPTKKDGDDEKESNDAAVDTQTNGSQKTSTNGDTSTGSQNGTNRVISQSLQSTSVPIPMVTFADNRHIIPKSFLRPNWPLRDLQHRSKSDSEAPTQRLAKQAQPPPPEGEFTFRQDAPNSAADLPKPSRRPTLEDKHSDSWGSTIKNKDLRNKVFDEAFLRQPIPIQHHRKPASQRRSLPNRNNAVLRASNSESNLKTAQQSQDSSLAQAPEESMRRRALKTAAEQRKSSIASIISSGPAKEDVTRGVENGAGQVDSDHKTGTSAPEYDIKRSEESPKGKRQRRYSSGGLRRKPTEVQEGRGNLKYFEEADDAGYKGDGEEEVFSMDPEPPRTQLLPSPSENSGLDTMNGDQLLVSSNSQAAVVPGTMLPAAPATFGQASVNLDIPRPVNPKEAQTQQGSRVEYFLLLEDLTAGMKKPCIMDLKMGTRQYGVEANDKKQKSQRTKCAATTSKELGVRVCGLQVWDVKTQSYVFQDKYFGRDLKAGREFQNALQRFLYDGVDYSSVLRHIPTILRKLAELEVLIRTLSGYRFYAASLLLFYDGDTSEEGESDSAASTATEKDITSKRKEIDFKIADFANCVVKEEYSTDRPCPPRHPDEPDRGFLRGLRSLKKYFLAVQKDLERREMGYAKEEINGNGVGGNINVADDDYDDEGNISY